MLVKSLCNTSSSCDAQRAPSCRGRSCWRRQCTGCPCGTPAARRAAVSDGAPCVISVLSPCIVSAFSLLHECTVGTWVGATVGGGWGSRPQPFPTLTSPPTRPLTPEAPRGAGRGGAGVAHLQLLPPLGQVRVCDLRGFEPVFNLLTKVISYSRRDSGMTTRGGVRHQDTPSASPRRGEGCRPRAPDPPPSYQVDTPRPSPRTNRTRRVPHRAPAATGAGGLRWRVVQNRPYA